MTSNSCLIYTAMKCISCTFLLKTEYLKKNDLFDRKYGTTFDYILDNEHFAFAILIHLLI